MKIQGRYFRPRDASLAGTNFDSKTEQRLSEALTYHSEKKLLSWKPGPIAYSIDHKYNPDALLHLSSTKQVYIEIKGYFQDSAEASKYLWVRKSLPPEAELVFVFETPTKAMHWLKKRKDGTKQTMAEWADKHGFTWYSEESFLEYMNATH